MPDVDALFDDFARRHARGEKPDVAAYLADAGDAADVLARMIDGLLVAVPAPPPDEAGVVAMRAWMEGRSPLLAVRQHRAVRRSQVVDAVMAATRLPARVRDRVADRYHSLESGALTVAGLDGVVRDALGRVLGIRLEALPAWRPPPAPAAAAPLLRGEPSPAAGIAPPAAGIAPPAADADEAEVDRLFGHRP